jgi:hypothetical protein
MQKIKKGSRFDSFSEIPYENVTGETCAKIIKKHLKEDNETIMASLLG